MELRSPVILGAGPAGLALACLIWLLFGGAARIIAPIDTAQARLDAAPAGRTSTASSPEIAVASALSVPLFGNASPEAPVRLDGLSKTPRRAAALVSINGGPSQWMTQGATRDGVTLVQVLSTKVVIDSRAGRSVISLGETSAGSASLAGSEGDQPPPGTRMPPPPASAPGAP